MDDNKEEKMVSMSLGDHLEELRIRLLLALAGLFVGLVICMCFGTYLIDLLLIPYNKAMHDINTEQEILEVKPSEKYTINLVSYEKVEEILEDQDDQKEIESLNLYIVNLVKIDKSDDLSIRLSPFKKGMELPEIDKKTGSANIENGFLVYLTPSSDNDVKRLTTIKPSEGFMVYIKTSLIFGLLLTSPWIIWQVWAFVASGLYKKERKFAYSVAPASAVLFISGSIFFITTIAPITMKFFVNFDAFLGFTSQFRPSDYIDMILMLTLVFGVAFQMPIVIVFAVSMGLISIEMLTKNRKFVILGLVVLSAMITPPEPISQLGLAIPLYMLYEISILACKIKLKHKDKEITA